MIARRKAEKSVPSPDIPYTPRSSTAIPSASRKRRHIPTGGRQHRDADRAQFAGDGLAVECRHTDAEAIDVRHLTIAHLLQPQARARGGEPDALGRPVSGGLHAEKLAVVDGRLLEIRHLQHDVVQADCFADRIVLSDARRRDDRLQQPAGRGHELHANAVGIRHRVEAGRAHKIEAHASSVPHASRRGGSPRPSRRSDRSALRHWDWQWGWGQRPRSRCPADSSSAAAGSSPGRSADRRSGRRRPQTSADRHNHKKTEGSANQELREENQRIKIDLLTGEAKHQDRNPVGGTRESRKKKERKM